MNKAKLYLVATPIGNLKDITFRAIEVLKQVDFIAAEDTRTSKKLMQAYEINTPMLSYHKFNEAKRSEQLIEYLTEGKNIAIISDAGSPGISDPSSYIVSKAIERDFEVIALPGATAFVPALTASGIDCTKFCFLGFAPEKKLENYLESVKHITQSLVFYESPHRIEKFLKTALKVLGNRKTCIAREISKLHESFYRFDLKDFDKQEIVLKGEFVVIFEASQKQEFTDEDIIAMLKTEFENGASLKTAVKNVQNELKIKKNRVYNLALKINKI